jgi:tetratricopeptide (TPR) repeat protein
MMPVAMPVGRTTPSKPRPHKQRGGAAAAFLAGLTSLLLGSWAGCGGGQRGSVAELDSLKKKTQLAQQDDFGIALDYLKMRDEHNLERSASQASFHLNKWIARETADPQWMISRQLINTIPDAIRTCAAAKTILSDAELAKLEFSLSDVVALEEARWLQAVARMIDESPLDPALQPWLGEPGLSPRAAKTLQTSLALFDWTIRNIQLDPLLEYPRTSSAGPLSPQQAADPTATWPPPMLAIPGPGYTQLPWHTLMYGHGDAYHRARVFILLLRQLRIDAAMLAIDTKTGRARPWLPAVRIDNELYLFDTALGLPLAGPEEQGIATLRQAVDNPAILAALNLGENYDYPVTHEDLDKVVALLDASGEQLSQRMLVAEKRLSAADQMILTIDVAQQAKRFAACPGITEVRLWAVPVEAQIYQPAYATALAQNVDLQRQEFLTRGVFQQHTPLVKGRRCYLLGQFNKTGDDLGAAGHFADSRIADATLEDIQDSLRVQTALGLTRPKNLTDEDWANQLAQLKRLQVNSKEHASYWMGLSHQQQRNYPVAVNWLQKRTLEKYPEGRWTHGASYNLARCYEAMGKTAEALKLYRIDESPQRYGNLLRAKYLESRAQTAAAPPQ